jgi:hypothetical protein
MWSQDARRSGSDTILDRVVSALSSGTFLLGCIIDMMLSTGCRRRYKNIPTSTGNANTAIVSYSDTVVAKGGLPPTDPVDHEREALEDGKFARVHADVIWTLCGADFSALPWAVNGESGIPMEPFSS